MKKKLLAGLATGLLVAGMASVSQATLTTIGTATYGGLNYNLIWDDDNNGNSVVWLDYSHAATDWSSLSSWAAGLNGSGILTYNIDAAYYVDWGIGNDWRLPSAGANPQTGFNQLTSEIGHLWYTELGFTQHDAPNDMELNAASDFNHLIASWYWSGTEYAAATTSAWLFNTYSGWQAIDGKPCDGYGLALRSGHVSTDPVPEPATMLLFGTGLVGLFGYGRKKKGIST